MKILSFDTSGLYLNAALFDTESEASFIYDNTQIDTKSHSINLLEVIESLLKQAVWSFSDIQKIAITKGPGSFTGLRIGATVAKIISSQLKTPMYGVSTLEVIYQSHFKDDQKYIPIIDARNQNVFAGVYENQKNVLADGHYPIAYLLEKFPEANFIVSENAIDNFPDIKNKVTTKESNLIDPVILAKMATDVNLVDAENFSPSYLRKTQAEMKWLENNQQGDNDVFLV